MWWMDSLGVERACADVAEHHPTEASASAQNRSCGGVSALERAALGRSNAICFVACREPQAPRNGGGSYAGPVMRERGNISVTAMDKCKTGPRSGDQWNKYPAAASSFAGRPPAGLPVRLNASAQTRTGDLLRGRPLRNSTSQPAPQGVGGDG